MLDHLAEVTMSILRRTAHVLVQALEGHLGIVGSAIAVGAVTLLIAFFSLIAIEETYGKNLDCVED